MDLAAIQQRIDAISWYHEFDFGNGLRAVPNGLDETGHRRIWEFIEKQLSQIDFRGKRVLDVGCWDGYWSFYAERQGAESVLATDDRSQNWSDGQGIHVARELLRSSIQIDQNLSVYRLASLQQKFDVVLFLGVYYHLLDPFYALAQIRHCCHDRSIVLIEGTVATELGPQEALFNFADRNCEFLPDTDGLRQLLRAAYFQETGCAFLDPPGSPGRLGWRWRLRMCFELIRGSRERIRAMAAPRTRSGEPRLKTANRRVFLTCKPFSGVNDLHASRPPFGLHAHDERFPA